MTKKLTVFGGALGLLWTIALVAVLSMPARYNYAFVGDDIAASTDLGDVLARRLFVLAVLAPILGLVLGFAMGKWLTRQEEVGR